MKRLIIAAALASTLFGCGTENTIDPKTGYGLINFANNEGSIVVGPGFIMVKRDSAYLLPNGNTYRTMAVRVYQVPNCKHDSLVSVIVKTSAKDSISY